MVLAKDRSVPAPVPSPPPMKSMMSAISAALRVVVPWSRSVATISATPGLSAGSCAEPARTSMRTLTTGCSFWRTTTTCRPFGSVRSS